MRERNLLHLFLALNVALAGAFIVYLFLSNRTQPEIVSTSFPSVSKTNLATNAMGAVSPNATQPKTNVPVMVSGQPTNPPPVAAQPPEHKPTFTAKKFTFEQVESDEYLKYIESLRAVGCPEPKVRSIIESDINELFTQKRVKEAISHDTQWWKAEPDPIMFVDALQAPGREIEEQRRQLVAKLLGSEALEKEKGESPHGITVRLSGPVLGRLPTALFNQVQEVCARAKERSEAVALARDNPAQPLNPVELAKMREQTRAELKQMLSAEEMEEFLLRYSQNALELRVELRALEPTPDEFRKAFRATDPMDHDMQLEYGSKAALSEKQRERYEHQREEAIKEALGPERFEAYLLAKDPLYVQAQVFARQYGAPKAVMPIYQMTRANESKRQTIMNDPALTPQQKADALNALNQEQQRSIQKMTTEAKPHGD